MKALFLNSPLTFSCIPRVYPASEDSLSLSLRNEANDVMINASIEFTVDELLNITITEQPTDFEIQNKYEAIIYNDTDIIYMGKIVVLKEDTDVQDYQYITQDEDGFKFKE